MDTNVTQFHGVSSHNLSYLPSHLALSVLKLSHTIIPNSCVMHLCQFHRNHYSSGPAELVFNGKSTGVKGLSLVFDSGSSYTYFNSQAYKAVVNLVRKKQRRPFFL